MPTAKSNSVASMFPKYPGDPKSKASQKRGTPEQIARRAAVRDSIRTELENKYPYLKKSGKKS